MKKLRVGLVLSQPFNYSLGTDSRIKAIVEFLSESKIETHLFVPVLTEVPLQNLDNLHYLSVLSGKSTVSVKAYELARRLLTNPFFSRLGRIESIMWNRIVNRYTQQLFKVLSTLKLDLLHAQQQIAALASVRLKHKMDIRVVADLHGPLAEEMIASGAIDRESRQAAFIMQLEKEICSNADVVVTISKELKDYFVRMYQISEKKTVVIPSPVRPKVDQIEMVFCPKKVVYSGMLAYRENVDLLIQTISLVQKKCPKAEFHITGARGEQSNYTQNLARSLGINLGLWWFPTSEELFKFLRSCHVGVISSTSDIGRKMSYPAKLFDYLAVGLPVVANDVGAWTNLIRKYKFGLVVKSDPQNFAEGILNLLENPELRYNYANNGLKFLQNRSDPSNLLLSLYERLAKDKYHREKQGLGTNN